MKFSAMKFSSWKLAFVAAIGMVLNGSPALAGNIIGIDFGTNGNLLGPSDTAGVTPQQNFNQAPGAAGSVLNLIDSTGASTAADASYSGFTGTFDFASTSTPDRDLVNSAAYIRNSSLTPVLTVTDVPYVLYDVVVYSTQGGTTRDSLFNIGTQNIYFRDTQAAPPFDQSSGTFAGDPAGNGNYMLFTGISGSSFTLNIQGLTGGGGLFQSGLGGIQIIDMSPPAPEPSTAVLLGLGIAACSTLRRKRPASVGASHQS